MMEVEILDDITSSTSDENWQIEIEVSSVQFIFLPSNTMQSLGKKAAKRHSGH